jgi:acetolactate synthase-1/2/3 large subunit
VNQLQAPFLVTPKVKGILPEDHPLFLGVASGMAIDGDILETIRTADCALGVGFDPVECDKTWFAEMAVLALDSAPMAEGEYHPTEVLGDVAALASALAALVEPRPWPDELVAARRRALVREAATTDQGLSPLRLIEELRAIFPRNGIVACDVGSHKLVMGQFWPSYEPGTFFVSNGLSGMGYGLPAAIAAQLAFPSRAVMAVAGDGGMLMMLHDLALIRELKLPIITVVFSDRSLSLIRVSQYRRGLPCFGVDFSPPDFAATAQAFGICGRRAATLAEVRAAIEYALTERTALVLDVPVDYREYYDLV